MDQAIAARAYVMALGWVMPLNWMQYRQFFDANIDNLQFQSALFEAAISAGVSKTNSTYVKMCDAYSYQSKVLQYPESDTVSLASGLKQASTDGYSIKSVYNAKIKGEWDTVAVLQLTTITTGACNATA